MKWTLIRLFDNITETVGALYHEDEFLCFTFEDQYQTKKVMHKARIPEGEYTIALRREGKLHQEYLQRFPSLHRGMLHLQNVPNFTYVYFHIGNTNKDTLGCILVGDSVLYMDERYGLVRSTKVYNEVYKKALSGYDNQELLSVEIKEL